MADTLTRRMTIEEFELTYADRRAELIDGEVVEMAPASEEHGDIELGIMSAVRQHAQQYNLGRAVGASTGVILSRDPDVVLQPDGAFIAATSGRAGSSYVLGSPDLVLEVVSPNDRAVAVKRKILRWLEAGVRVVWVVWPATATVEVWRGRDRVETLSRTDTLTCEDLLPGFALPLDTIFIAD